MAFENAVSAIQQGTQYLSTAGAWSGLDGGAAGRLLTSNGTGVAPSFQAYTSTAWTPVLSFGGASVGITGTFTGSYIRVGDLVFVRCTILLTSKGVSVGNARITGFPFLAAPIQEHVANIPYFSVLTLDVNYTGIFVDFGAASPGSLFQVGSGQNVAALDDANFANTTVLVFNGFYYAS